MTDNKNTESTRIETLIPQQLINDSAALVEFLKEYYKFLSQSEQPSNVINYIIQNKDLDNAVEKYISIIQKELNYGMVSNLEANKINLYKNIEQFYDVKGSLDSFKLLFRLLYNSNIEIFLPKEQILIASGGDWNQETALFSETLSGDVFTLVNSQIYVTNTNGSKIKVEVERVRFVKDNIYEIIINQNYIGTINKSATITTDSYSGELVNSIGAFTIIQRGRNFKIGQILEVNDGINDNSKSLIKITNVDNNGGIINFEFLRFGIDYENDFSTFLIPVNYDSDFDGDPSDYGYTSDKLGRVFENLNSNDYFSLELNPYSIGYFKENYLEGSVFSGNYDAVYNQSTQIDDINSQVVLSDEELDEINTARAVINFKLTPVSRYSGLFSTNKGFLSDDIYLQDNNYYQAFSYVIRSDKKFENYSNIVRKTVHPAGMTLFGQFEITNELEAATAIELLERSYLERLLDSVDTIEEHVTLVIKSFDSVDDELTTSEFWYYDHNKPLTENVSLIEFIEEKITNKPQFDSVSTADIISDISFGKKPSDTIITSEEILDIALSRRLVDSIGAIDSGLVEQSNAYAFGYFAQNYSEGLIESGVDKSLFKPIFDSVEVEDFYQIESSGKEIITEVNHTSDITETILQKGLSNSISTNESVSSIQNKPLENSINTSEFGLIDKNSYSLQYFAENYIDGISNF